MISSSLLILAFSASLYLFELAMALPKPNLAIQIPLIKRRSHLPRISQTSAQVVKGVDEIYAAVHVGTPPQSFNVVIDTGSPVLWVHGVNCPKNDCRFNRFDANQSSTFQDANAELNLSYLGGSRVRGKYGYDTISFGGYQLKRQLFGMSEFNGSLDEDSGVNFHPEGLIGLGLSTAVTNGTNSLVVSSFVSQLVSNRVISEPVFALSFSTQVNAGEIAGELMIGGTNPTRYTSKIFTVPVVHTTKARQSVYWQSYAQGLNVIKSANSVYEHGILADNIAAIMDSGTIFSFLPEIYASHIYTAFTGLDSTPDRLNVTWPIDCSLKSSNDFFRLSLSHSTLNTAKDPHPLIIEIALSSFVENRADVDANTCFFTMIPMPEDFNDGALLFGQNFLHNLYVVHDQSNKKLGFATPTGSSSRVYIA